MADDPRILGVSSFAISILAIATGLPETSLATIVRSLVVGGAWANRERPVLRASDAVKLILGLASPSPGAAFDFAQRAGEMTLMIGLRSEATPWTSALPADLPFADYLVAIVTSLMSLTEDARAALSRTAVNAEWSLDICPAPLWAHIRWVEVPTKGSPVSRKSTWTPAEGSHAGWIPRATGVARITCVPFGVLVAAAEACLEAQRRADAKLSTVKLTRGSGVRRNAAPNLRTASTDAPSRNDTAATKPLQGLDAAVGNYQTSETRI